MEGLNLEGAVQRRSRKARKLLLLAVFITAAGSLAFSGADMAHLLGWGPGFLCDAASSECRSWPNWGAQLGSSISTLFGLIYLLRMLSRWAEGDVFSGSTGKDLRGFARWLFIGFAIQVLVPLIFWISGAIGSLRPMNIEVSGSDLLLLVASVVLYQVAGLLDLAHRLSTDHSQIV